MEDLKDVAVFCLLYSGVIIYTLWMTVKTPKAEFSKVRIRK